MGRQREMAQLRAALDDALSGHGQLLMLAGEPGIGKTRTAQVLGHEAEEQGVQVLWGWCYEEQGAPPYWPWVQAIRSYVQQAGAEQLTAEMGPGAADIAEIVPEIRGKLPDLETPPALEAESARFRLFDSITTFLKNAAQRQPLMLVLDDLHWADRSSLLLLEFVAQEIGNSPLLLVGAYRDVEVSRRHPLSHTLGALVRGSAGGGFHRVQLDGLTQQEVGKLVEGSAGIILTLEAAQVIHKRTDGNPFFVGEVTRQVTLENITQDERWASTIPEGVRDAIGRRLNRLSDLCNQMLTTASIIGREFDFKLLTLVTSDIAESRLLEAMDEAVGAYLVEEAPSSIERYRFSHALIQETLSEELTASRRVRLHARIAQALEELYGDDAEAHAEELAHHFAEAEAFLGTDKLVRYSLLAGQRALAGYAYEEALSHFHRALAAKEGHPADAEAAALLFGLARAQAATRLITPEFQEPFNNLRLAFDYYVRAGDVAAAVAVAEHPIAVRPGAATGRAELISDALALVPPDSLRAGFLLAAFGLSLYQETADHHGAQEAFGRALVIAEKEQDQVLEMRTLTDGAVVDFWQLRWQEAVERGQRAVALARRLDYPLVEAAASFEMARALAGIGRREEAERLSQAMLPAAESLRDITSLRVALWMNGTLCRSAGNWQDARPFLDRGLVAVAEDRRVLTDLAVLDYQVGDVVPGEAHMDLLLEFVANRPTPPGGIH